MFLAGWLAILVEHLAELQSKQHYEPNRPHISSVLVAASLLHAPRPPLAGWGPEPWALAPNRARPGTEWAAPEAPIKYGALAQLGEHLLCKQRVIGSIPIGSTRWVGSSGG
jgi:hypothetical protein